VILFRQTESITTERTKLEWK